MPELHLRELRFHEWIGVCVLWLLCFALGGCGGLTVVLGVADRELDWIFRLPVVIAGLGALVFAFLLGKKVTAMVRTIVRDRAARRAHAAQAEDGDGLLPRRDEPARD